MMVEEKEEIEAQDKKKQEKEQEPLPFCTTAPSAEHTRGGEGEEPCDDFREGK